jgi:hypothetical protein
MQNTNNMRNVNFPCPAKVVVKVKHSHYMYNVYCNVLSTCNKSKVRGIMKGKAIPLQAWTVPEGSRRLRLPDFKTIGT